MKIAILHEMLIKIGGAEKVVENIIRLFPNADLYTLIYDEKKVGQTFPKDSLSKQCFSLPSQRLYSLTKKQRWCLPLMKRSVEKLDFSSYDWVIVSSSGFAHGLKTNKHTKTLVYYHAPARYMWDWTNEYKKEIGLDTGIKGYFFGRFLLTLRQWDYQAAQNHGTIFTNSHTTQKRIWKYYRKNSQILSPPVETQRFQKEVSQKNNLGNQYYIVLSALTEFKRIDIALKNWGELKDIELKIIGDGDYREALQEMATENVEFLGAKYGDELVGIVQNSLGLIFPGEEDFGIVPIEVMAAGKPVFALKKGGLTETVIPGKTGEFFQNPEGDDFIEKFKQFHKNNISGTYTSDDCKAQAQKYDKNIFETTLTKTIT